MIRTDSKGGPVDELGAGFVRVSSGSQDETSQIMILTEEAAQRGIEIVKWFKLHGYSASKGAQEPALREVIADIQRRDYTTLMVTESSRLDRRDDLDAQAEILLSIRSAGGDIISIAEPQFGKTDFAGRIVTLVAQHANAEKSRTVKKTTFRGIALVIANNAHHGPLPTFWATRGERHAKQAYCSDLESVRDIYERVASNDSILSIGRDYNLHAETIRRLIRFSANHTGVVENRYTDEGVMQTWTHKVEPVVDSPLWWRANKALDANKTPSRRNKGGRPVARPVNWISGILDCPSCGGRVHYRAGFTPAGKPRVPTLRCSGHPKQHKACGVFKGCDAVPITYVLDRMFRNDTTPILAFQRVAGNSHELDEMHAERAKIQSQLSATEDDDELEELVAKRKALRAAIDKFEVVRDVYDYAEVGQTVADMWKSGDTDVRRGMVRAIKDSWGLTLSENDGVWGIKIGTGFKDMSGANGIIDLGNGLCFRWENHPGNGG
ncbi:Site-specific recombinase, DNA invertase Pin [Frankia canadensis]|uniref:Site-specific recombinase, DNA invertase Pin n=1 Tax=Frankia canadensis TaxID=1836972 RepID=A0A2I2KMY0_9ACTN|nr:recombinase family protein [Frankia canadensis]SNQ47027.1 Site-specific recombinase, DNA invertase Pin [Frankia canadensis]SOU54317.1 Site-specific recombinase, DNA invertase Pin [Frankia canadensis]